MQRRKNLKSSSTGAKAVSSSKLSQKAAKKSGGEISDLKGLRKALKYDEFKDDGPKSLSGTQRNSALKILKSNGYKKVSNYWVPPKGKGETYTDYRGRYTKRILTRRETCIRGIHF